MKSLKILPDADFQALFPVLDGLSLPEIARLRSHMTECRYKRRDVLMQQGKQGSQVLFLAHGHIKVVTGGAHDKNDLAQTVVSFCARGELLGEINALTAGGHSADVIAEEACFVWSMTVEDFLDYLADMPRLSMNISRLLAQRTRKATEQLHIVATMSAEQRVAYNLHAFAQTIVSDNVLANDTSAIDAFSVNTPSTHISTSVHTSRNIAISDLSSMCGCSNKHVQRALKTLCEAGFIERTKGRVRVLNSQGLKAYAMAGRCKTT